MHTLVLCREVESFGTLPILITRSVRVDGQEVSNSLLRNDADDIDKDSGVRESVAGDWNVKTRERMAKHHKQGVKSLKVRSNRFAGLFFVLKLKVKLRICLLSFLCRIRLSIDSTAQS